jgi:MFS family permease
MIRKMLDSNSNSRISHDDVDKDRGHVVFGSTDSIIPLFHFVKATCNNSMHFFSMIFFSHAYTSPSTLSTNPYRYDFAVYGLLAPEIGASFFPSASKELQLINSFGVYLAAFLMRPMGAVLFGEMGDRIVGRKNALVFSIVLITVPSILMGCLPTYATWGWISPVLLVLLRMMQGLSMGGQLAGSYILSIEQSSARSRGFRGSLCDASSVRQHLYKFLYPYH